jgi:hypothetical protein
VDVAFSIKGDLAVQRRFQTAGERVRNAVTAAIFGMMRETESIAKSRAPRGKTGRLQAGIVSAMLSEGETISPPNNGNAITNAQLARYRALAKDKSSVVGVVASTWYTGRFFEGGVSKRVWVGEGKRTAGYNAYTRSKNAAIRSIAKKKGLGPLDSVTYGKIEAKATRASDRASMKAGKTRQFYRNQRLAARPFMGPARDAIAGIFESTVQDAVDRAVSSGG